MMGPTLCVVAVLGLEAIGAAQAPRSTAYAAPDGSLSLRVPTGWRASTVPMNGVPVHVLQPADGGEDRILVASGPAEANTIQDVTVQAIQIVTQQLLPGSRLTSMPKYVNGTGGSTAELSYQAADLSVWWHEVALLKDRRVVSVLAGARRERAAALEQQSRAVFASIKLAAVAPATGPAAGAADSDLARLIIGHWTWYHRTGGSGSTSREIS